MTELLQQTALSAEAQLLYRTLDIDPANVTDQEAPWLEAYVSIVENFSQPDPQTGARTTLSPSRVAAIPAITDRHMQLVKPARGVLTPQEVVRAWQDNMPDFRSGRHPDLLFDIAQYNFGTDESTLPIEGAIMRTELERRALIRQFKSHMRSVLAPLRFRGDIPEEEVDVLMDEISDLRI